MSKTGRKKKVLLVTEGEKYEPLLFERLYKQIGIDQDHLEIFPYRTNLYTLYQTLKKNYKFCEAIDYENIDFILFLNECAVKRGQQPLLKTGYFDETILIFDYDPHDKKYKREIILEMMRNFSQPEELGKLYINYPMVESFQDVKQIPDQSFRDREVSFQEFVRGKYKNDIKKYTCIPAISDIGREDMIRLIEMHRDKVNYILGEDDTKLEERYISVCERQCDKFDKDMKVWVLNTSILYIQDEYGERFKQKD